MTDSPSEASSPGAAASAAAVAERFASLVGAESWSAEHDTAKIVVAPEQWVEAHTALKEHLPFFSWLAGVDWAGEVAVGEPPADEDVEERFELLSRLADVDEGKALVVSTSIPKDDPEIESLVEVYGGASWHERETHEMYGIDFVGHPNLVKLYLPDGFRGHPLRKSFPLLSREVKPWPGTVDVEDMPSTDNVEAATQHVEGSADNADGPGGSEK